MPESKSAPRAFCAEMIFSVSSMRVGIKRSAIDIIQAVQALSDDDVRLVTESDGGYVVRFRLLELWDALVQRLS